MCVLYILLHLIFPGMEILSKKLNVHLRLLSRNIYAIA